MEWYSRNELKSGPPDSDNPLNILQSRAHSGPLQRTYRRTCWDVVGAPREAHSRQCGKWPYLSRCTCRAGRTGAGVCWLYAVMFELGINELEHH